MRLVITLFLLCFSGSVFSAELNLSDQPLFLGGSKTALVQLVVERDNKLFFEAYPSYEDINGDGVLDNKYKPTEIDYFGYFDSHFCYVSLGTHLEPTSQSTDKKCGMSWSGDFLNYLTMTRMDIMLRALYGGKRIVDEVGNTRLRRTFVPWENHTWGIEYTSPAVDGYLISDYSPLAQPGDNTRHLLSTSNVQKNDIPYLRIREDSGSRIWEWVDKERTQGDGWASQEFVLDVEVCKTGFIEEVCQQYPDGGYKPVGLLHEYGENNAMYFSLLTGSYENNLQGGVLRQAMGSFGEKEINPLNGTFTRAEGIVTTLDALQIPNDFHSDTVQNDCGWIYDRSFGNGECRAWGNPVAEMMYEGMRYLSGVLEPTPSFEVDSGMDKQLGLPSATWDDPYSATQPYAECSGAYQLVISDPSPSFDGDQLPGSDFANFTETSLGDLHVGNLADFISGHESVLPGLKFIGEVGADADGSPSPKWVTSFRNIRGQAPEAPHRQGSYYAPSVAYHGNMNDIHPDAPGKQSVGNFTLALGSPLPSIEVKVGGKIINFAPFAKTVLFCGKNTPYKPTNAIVGFTVEDITDDSGSFRVSFEDMEQGADNDMDAVSRYSYNVTGNSVEMKVDSIAAAGCAIQHMGYTVSGSTNDGVHLVVRDSDTQENKDPDYELDVPPGAFPEMGWADNEALPLTSTVVFSPSSNPSAEQLPSPLWYAAKWGGFKDVNEDGIPQQGEWDADGDGTPDNYFAVSDPSRMVRTMRSVFNSISEEAGAATSISVSAGSLKIGNTIYRSEFKSGKWTGDVLSQQIDVNGNIDANPDWSANDALAGQIETGTRNIITYNPDSKRGVDFTWPGNSNTPGQDELSVAQVNALSLNPITDLPDIYGAVRLDYIRGAEVDGFRRRSAALGDIVHSSPILVGPPSYRYESDWGDSAPENSKPYADFRKQYENRSRVVYVGANDGMLHAFDAGSWDGSDWSTGTGKELFAYIPSAVYPQLPELGNPHYGHKYFVDATPTAGDVFINNQWRSVLVGGLGKGGQGIYALDITDPTSIREGNANSAVLWEFTDREDRALGYTYSSPVIARMQNGRWAAVVANGYNNSAFDVGYRRGGGWSSVYIIDIETGDLIKKLTSSDKNCRGSQSYPNGMAQPTVVDLDGDKIADRIYAGDLYGCVHSFDVSSTNVSRWKKGSAEHYALDSDGGPAPITTAIAVGTHPTGEGVLLYFGTGKYLEPSDQHPSGSANRFYAIWDKADSSNTQNLTKISAGKMLEQSIVSETARDGVDIRLTSQHPIDWDTHEGWYMELQSGSAGEQVVAAPLLRDGKLLMTTHLPSGDECVPEQEGWFMVLDATSGSMLNESPLDIDGDGVINGDPIAGIKNRVNPFAPPTIVAGPASDIILTQDETNPAASSTGLASSFSDGRLTWREMQP